MTNNFKTSLFGFLASRRML